MLKQLAKQVIPADIWRELHVWRHSEPEYLCWSHARLAAGSYDNDGLTRFRIARDRGPDTPIEAEHPLALAITRLPQGAPVQITDLGGGVGEMQRRVRLRFPFVSATIVEHPGMVAAARPTAGLQWATTSPATCDLFYSGGTLQYLPKPYAALRRGFASARHGVILTRNCFSPRRLIRLQRGRLFDHGEGPIPAGFADVPVTLPVQTIQEDRILAIAGQYGFSLIFAARENSGVQRLSEQVYGKQMLFWREGA